MLAASVIAPFDLPRFRNAAMDGFAIRCADLHRDGDEWVGSAVVPVSTGQRVPGQADAVVPIELARVDGHQLRIRGEVRPGAHIRSAGEELRAGHIALEAGTALTPPGVGLLAALGVTVVAVIRRPRVGLLVTGDELVGVQTSAGHPEPGPEQVYDANGPMLTTLVKQAGGDVTHLVRSKDVGGRRCACEGALRMVAAGVLRKDAALVRRNEVGLAKPNVAETAFSQRHLLQAVSCAFVADDLCVSKYSCGIHASARNERLTSA